MSNVEFGVRLEARIDRSTSPRVVFMVYASTYRFNRLRRRHRRRHHRRHSILAEDSIRSFFFSQTSLLGFLSAV